MYNQQIREALEVHDELNPILWENGKLRDEVRKQLLTIVKKFIEYYETPISLIDVIICGSNAGYNYSATSDIDLHIIANYENVSTDISLLTSLYDMEKSEFNNTFDMSIHGVEVELYVQDVNSSVTSNGMYSVLDNKWIKEPKVIRNIPEYDLTKEITIWTNKINSAIYSKDIDKMKDTVNEIYKFRKNSIASEGEYSKGNQLFKELRNMGLIRNIKDEIKASLKQELTLESTNTINEFLLNL